MKLMQSAPTRERLSMLLDALGVVLVEVCGDVFSTTTTTISSTSIGSVGGGDDMLVKQVATLETCLARCFHPHCDDDIGRSCNV